MKIRELEDADQLATKADLRELRVELIDRIQAIERRINDLQASMRWQIVVPSLTLVVSLIIHYILR
jgi:hypothetical protein